MNTELSLSATEHKILLQLLERERAELPVEIHHCDVAEAKDYLRLRLSEIDRLIEKAKKLSPVQV
ncbi:MAG TPA: hypothetical protein V6C97_14915 [Oculatellaceae cyanobacterium]